MRFARTVLWLGLLTSTRLTFADDPRPALTVRLDHPDRQARAVIELFRGARSPHPAAALAAWKRASLEPDRLGKPLEALIAAFNPAMTDELRVLDGAELALWSDPEGHRLSWGAFLPRDDGTFAELATAFVLSGGAAEPPIDGLVVDRLGPPGSPLMARDPRALLVGGSLEGLKEARERSRRPQPPGMGDRTRVSLDKRVLDDSPSIDIRRLRALLESVRGTINGSVGLDRSTLKADLFIPQTPPVKLALVDPRWLAWIPFEQASAAFAIAVDPALENWDAAFRLADRVEKADPDRQGVAPVRLRLDLIARTLGLRLDNDLFPHLRGITGWVGTDERSVDRAFLMLHLDDQAVAERILRGAGPAGLLPDRKSSPIRELGLISGRPSRLRRFGSDLVGTWGEGVMELSMEAREHPERSASSVASAQPSGPGSFALALVWPGRIVGFVPSRTPLARSLALAPPVTCSGTWENQGGLKIEANWTKLDLTIRRFLELIPLDPPTDH